MHFPLLFMNPPNPSWSWRNVPFVLRKAGRPLCLPCSSTQWSTPNQVLSCLSLSTSCTISRWIGNSPKRHHNKLETMVWCRDTTNQYQNTAWYHNHKAKYMSIWVGFYVCFWPSWNLFNFTEKKRSFKQLAAASLSKWTGLIIQFLATKLRENWWQLWKSTAKLNHCNDFRTYFYNNSMSTAIGQHPAMSRTHPTFNGSPWICETHRINKQHNGPQSTGDPPSPQSETPYHSHHFKGKHLGVKMDRWRSHPGKMSASYPPLILVYLTGCGSLMQIYVCFCSKWDECPTKTAIEIECGPLRSVINGVAITLIKDLING